MTTKQFKMDLTDILERSMRYVTDTIDMEKLRKDAKDQGFDDILFVAGEDEDQTFVLVIKKIFPNK